MAIHTLEAQSNPQYQHKPYHDLESFYWLLVYMALLYTSHSLHPLACSDLFDIKIGQEAADAKKKWLDNYPLKITDNEPFTDILKQLTVLVKEQLTASPESPVLTHKDVLTILDRGLSSSGWPEARCPCSSFVTCPT